MALRASAELIELLRRERIVNDQDLERARRLAVNEPQAAKLAAALVGMGMLTPFQRDMILRGKAATLLVGDYLLLQPCGEGGMGTVYKARRRDTDRIVGLKVVRSDVLDADQIVKRFEREMHVATQVDHPNIVRALDSGQANGRCFYVMEFVDGVDLATLVQEDGPLPIALACDFARQTALGLQHLYERGLVHRDIKPPNLMAVSSKTKEKSAGAYEGVKILDLGLAVLRPPEMDGKTVLRLTRVGASMGTPDFMAPEQTVDAHKVDIRADLYSLGCTLYYLLTAETVFHGRTPAQKVFQHRELPAPDVRQLRPEVPQPLAQVLAKLLAKKPGERYPTPMEAAAALEAFCGEAIVIGSGKQAARGSTHLTANPPPPTRIRQSKAPATPVAMELETTANRKRLAWVLGGAGIFALLLGFLIFSLFRGGSEPGDAPDTEKEPELVIALEKREAKTFESPAAKGLSKADKGPVKSGPKPAPTEPIQAAKVKSVFPLKLPRPFGHDQAVTCLALSLDGKRLFSGSGDATIKVWDLEAGKESLTLSGHTSTIWCLALSPDGKRLFSGSSDYTIKEWDLDEGEESRTLRGHKHAVTSLALSLDGKRLFSGSDNGESTIKEWDLAAGKELRMLGAHAVGRITSLALSSDGKRLFSGCTDQTIKVWDLDLAREPMTLLGHNFDVTSLALSSDGKRLFSGSSDETIGVWNFEPGIKKFELRGHTSPVYCLALSMDGMRLFSGSGKDNRPMPGSEGRTIKVWDLERGTKARTLGGHKGSVLTLAMSRNGLRLFSGSDDHTIKVWDVEGAKEITTDIEAPAVAAKPRQTAESKSEVPVEKTKTDFVMKIPTSFGHDNGVTSLAVSPDGKRLFSGSWDKTIKVWSLEAGKETQTLRAHTDIVWSLALSADGKRLFSGSYDKTIKVWDLEASKEIRTLRGHTGLVLGLALSADGKRLFSGSYDQTIKVWDLEAGKEIRSLIGHTGYVVSLALSADGKRLFSGGADATIMVWDLEAGKVTRRLHGHTGIVWSLALSADGKRLFSGSGDHTIKAWDLESGKETRSLRGHMEKVTSLALSADGERLFSGSSDLTIKVWDLEAGKETRSLLGHTNDVRSLALSRDGKRLFSGSDDKTIKVWDLESGKEDLPESVVKAKGGKAEKTVEGLPAGPGKNFALMIPNSFMHDQAINCLALSSDGKRLVSGSEDMSIKVWDLELGRALQTLRGHEQRVSSLALTPDGKWLFSGSSDHKIKVWDPESGTGAGTLNGHAKPVTSLQLSRDGKLLVSGGWDDAIKVWDVDANKVKLALGGHKHYTTSLALSSDGQRLFSGSLDETIKFWDLKAGKATLTQRGHKDGVMCLALSADGNRLYSGGWDKTIKIWDSEKGTEMQTLRGHMGQTTCLALSSDGKRLFSGSGDKTIKAWNLEKGEEMFTLRGHISPVSCLALSPDGKWLFSGAFERYIRVWNVETGMEVFAGMGD